MPCHQLQPRSQPLSERNTSALIPPLPTTVHCDHRGPSGGDDLPFAADSTVNKFAHLVLKLLDACETGSIGGDAIRIGNGEPFLPSV